MISYTGQRIRMTEDSPSQAPKVIVSVCGEHPIMRRNLVHLVRHSPDGFEWGYGGSGPAELARCILADFLGSESLAEEFYQKYKWDVIATINNDTWEITVPMIMDWFQTRYPSHVHDLYQDRVERREKWLSQF